MSGTTSMLLCLDRRQRIVYILGEIFGVQSDLGAEILELTPVNFRQVLARARRDLTQFMQHNCGLINQENPCRCARKTRAFIDLGRVDPKQHQFTRDFLSTVSSLAPSRTTEIHTLERAQREGLLAPSLDLDAASLGYMSAIFAMQYSVMLDLNEELTDERSATINRLWLRALLPSGNMQTK